MDIREKFSRIMTLGIVFLTCSVICASVAMMFWNPEASVDLLMRYLTLQLMPNPAEIVIGLIGGIIGDVLILRVKIT